MCLTKRLLSEPLFSVGTGVQEFNRYPSTVNRQACSCLMQWSDRKLTAFGMSHERRPQSPCSMWEQELNRYPSTVNRVLVSCSGVIGNSLLLVCHTERRPQSPCSMWEQELNRYPSTVNRQPCLSVSLDCSQQLIQNCIRA